MNLVRHVFDIQAPPELRITLIEPPTLVAWEGVRGHDAWGATTIRFRLDGVDAGTLVHFWHQMGPERSEEAVGSANFIWGYCLDSMRLLCETGHGKPYRSGAADARVGASTTGW